MDMNEEYLNYIYQNSEMGIESVENLIKIIDDAQTLEHLKKQLAEYKTVNSMAFKKLHELGHQEKDLSAMKKIISYVSINAQTLMDKTPDHVAEIMMQGNVMGIIDIVKNQKKYVDADKEVIELGSLLMKLEEDAFNQWKQHLCGTVA